jgi:hypothetical protein
MPATTHLDAHRMAWRRARPGNDFRACDGPDITRNAGLARPWVGVQSFKGNETKSIYPMNELRTVTIKKNLHTSPVLTNERERARAARAEPGNGRELEVERRV